MKTVSRASKMLVKISGFAIVIAFSLLMPTASNCATDLVFIRTLKSSVVEQEHLKTATDFYGLNLKVVVADSASDSLEISKAVQRKETLGVAVAADALAAVNQDVLLRSLHRERVEDIPLLILDVEPYVDPMLLRAWSGGAVSGCSRVKNPIGAQYLFGRSEGLTLQLTELQFPVSSKDFSYLIPGEKSPLRSLISIRDDQQISPMFVAARVGQQKVFLASAMPPNGDFPGGEDIISVFLRIAPEMMFVRYCAREFGWHALHHFANFTIDDPWLRQPYGFVDYEGLLEEMKKHNFHTTIAFIPWNFDRSEPRVVSLIRDHPDRFSIAIHGNNHDHKEFTDFRSKPLNVQVGDLKQSLARMEQFRGLTGIPYDRVMIFPHSIAPEGTLEALKKYNYLATVNSSNVPQGSVKESDDLFELRPVTVSFADLPSISRYSVAAPISQEFIAINEFLDNPLLFYAHSDLFAQGINAFDGTADKVNTIEPDVQWRGLGDIVAQLYLVKLREDRNYDVLAFANNINLENTSGRDAVFYLQKREIGQQVIKAVAVDGQPYAYRVENGFLNLSVAVAKGQRRHVSVEYDNDLVLASIDPSHDSAVVYFLRLASDFRDIYLGKSRFGLAFIRAYNDHNLKPWQVLGSLSVMLIVCMYTVYRLRRFASRKRSMSKGIVKCSAPN
jgi:hypothetical protein